MAFQLDHIFILTGTDAAEAESLTAIGLVEGAANFHPGQGTANRRFFCANTMLELLYLCDPDEARNGPGKGLRLAQRLKHEQQASPFGLILRRETGVAITAFPGWPYFPEYLADGMFFQVGANSDNLLEPLCICMPDDLRPPDNAAPPENPNWSLSRLSIAVPVTEISETLQQVNELPNVSVTLGQAHLLELGFNQEKQGRTHDFRPLLPLVIRY